MIIIGIIHLLLPVLLLLYTLFAPLQYDKVVLIILLLAPLHWVLLEGECVLSYLYKKCKNQEYKLGDNVELNDIVDGFEYIKHHTGINIEYVLKNRTSGDNFMIVYLLFLSRVIVYKSVHPTYIPYLVILFLLYTCYFARNYKTFDTTTKNVYKWFSILFSVYIIKKIVSNK